MTQDPATIADGLENKLVEFVAICRDCRWSYKGTDADAGGRLAIYHGG